MENLPVGCNAQIIGYAAHNSFTERLREFGLVEGTTFRILRKAPLNGPIEVQYGHTQIVLRPDELEQIRIKRVA